MFGGANQQYDGVIPSDIEIRRNYFKKQPVASWAASWSIKNLLEFKNGQRILVEGNVFDTNYLDSQVGYSILVTPRTEDGAEMGNVTNDITIRFNSLKNCECGLNLSGTDGVFASDIANRINVENNLFIVKDLGQGSDRRSCVISGGPNSLEFLHNTFIFASGTTGGSAFFVDQASAKTDSAIFRDNVLAAGTYGFLGSGSSEGTESLGNHFTTYTYSYNVMYGSSNSGSYPAANNQFPAAATDVFTDYANGDYTVKAAYQGDASDATDPGCDIAAMEAATLHAEDGQWGPEPPTYSDRAYTNAELPRTYVNTTYAAQTGNTWTVTSSSGGSVAGTGDGNRTDCSLAYALANCAIGDTISVLYTLTITGSFTLRDI